MKAFNIILTAVVLALVLSLPADVFAFGGGRPGRGHHSNNNHSGQNNNGHSQKSNHYEGVGDNFFDDNDKDDPFLGFSNHENDEEGEEEGENEFGDNKNKDSEEEDNPLFSENEDDPDEWDYSGFVGESEGKNGLDDAAPIPEPATVSLMLLGGAGLGLIRRKKMKS